MDVMSGTEKGDDGHSLKEEPERVEQEEKDARDAEGEVKLFPNVGMVSDFALT